MPEIEKNFKNREDRQGESESGPPPAGSDTADFELAFKALSGVKTSVDEIRAALCSQDIPVWQRLEAIEGTRSLPKEVQRELLLPLLSGDSEMSVFQSTAKVLAGAGIKGAYAVAGIAVNPGAHTWHRQQAILAFKDQRSSVADKTLDTVSGETNADSAVLGAVFVTALTNIRIDHDTPDSYKLARTLIRLLSAHREQVLGSSYVRVYNAASRRDCFSEALRQISRCATANPRVDKYLTSLTAKAPSEPADLYSFELAGSIWTPSVQHAVARYLLRPGLPVPHYFGLAVAIDAAVKGGKIDDSDGAFLDILREIAGGRLNERTGIAGRIRGWFREQFGLDLSGVKLIREAIAWSGLTGEDEGVYGVQSLHRKVYLVRTPDGISLKPDYGVPLAFFPGRKSPGKENQP